MHLPKYQIIKQDEEAGQLVIKVSLPADLIFFKGHFPDFPILPGVAQIFIAEQLASRYFPMISDFTGLKQLKFRRPITPVNFLFLTLELKTDTMTLSFQFHDDTEVKSKGHINFKT